MEAVQPLSDYEIERGKPLPSVLHSLVESKLTAKLSLRYGEKLEILPELSLCLSTIAFTPDICVYSKMKITFEQEEECMTEPPLGIVEILTKSQPLSDLIGRRSAYFDAGVKSFWVVIPTFKTIHVFQDANHYTTFAEKDTLQDDQLNITLPLTEIFPV
jgi:hypothetical protein